MIDGDLRPLFRKHLPYFHWTSIESGGTVSGIPDSSYCSRGVEGFIEFKVTDGYAVTLNPYQIGWICARVRHGGRVWIGVRRRSEAGPRKGAAVDELWFFPGALAKEARLVGLRGLAKRPEVLRWSGGPSSWGWSVVADRLRS
jgi:hypothetical protein